MEGMSTVRLGPWFRNAASYASSSASTPRVAEKSGECMSPRRASAKPLYRPSQMFSANQAGTEPCRPMQEV